MNRLPQRLQEKIRPCPTSGCWLWIGDANDKGYGMVKTRNGRTCAHRVVYIHLRGAIPDGLQLDHLCRNTSCVNPDHLEPVTPQENMARGIGKSSTALRTGKCVHGHSDWKTRKTGGRYCAECARKHCREYRTRNLEKSIQRVRDYRAKLKREVANG